MTITPRSGQVMLLTVTVISASILGATTIAGVLMLYQIRQANDILNSTRAIYAADAGIERGLYCANPAPAVGRAECDLYTNPWGPFTNDAQVVIDPAPPYGPGGVVLIRSIGTANRVQRAFEIVIEEAGEAE